MTVKKIVLFVILLISIKSYSQTRRFKHLTSNEGISQSEVYTFLEDKSGFIWFGTVDGLNKYDGYNIEIFNTNRNDAHSLSNNTVRCLVEDKTGRIWIGTDNGLNMYDPTTDMISQVNVNNSENKLTVWSLLIQNEKLLVGTTEGLWETKIVSKNITDIESNFYKVKRFCDNVNNDNFVRSLIKCKLGGIWVATSNNISRIIFQPNKKEPIIIEDAKIYDFTNISAAIEDSLGNLWVASSKNGLFRYNPITKTSDSFNNYGTLSGLSSIKCSSLAIDKSGNLWIGTLDKGLNFVKSDELNKKEIHVEKVQNEPFNTNSLNSNLIYSLYVSKDNLLWVGTIGSGVNIFNPEQKKFQYYKFRDPKGEISNSNFIRSVYVDDKNQIWAGTHGNGLFLINRKTNGFRKIGFETLSIFFISPFKENKIFICSSSGLYLVKLVNQKLELINSICPDTAVFNIVKGKDDFYWVATLNGLKSISIKSNNIITHNTYTINSTPKISNNNCRVLCFDKNNKLFLGTEGGGLNVIDLNKNNIPETIRFYKKRESQNCLSNNYVRSIIIDKNKQVWVGTYEGLNKLIYDSDLGDYKIKTYSKKDGLPNNMIQLIVEDNNNDLWIGTNGGLSNFNTAEGKFINYSIHDGIQSNEFSEHTIYKKPDGEIILGGINGITAFYPKEIKPSSLKPKTTITGLYLFNQKIKLLDNKDRKSPLTKNITLTDTIVLQPKQKNIGFEFSAMIYPNSEKILYAYKLEGFDENWHYTDSKNRIANYTNLRHGKYTFMVKSTNSDGVWENSPREISIFIKTPFIFTWYAYVIYFLVVILILTYFSHYSIIRYTTKKKLLLEKKHNEKLHELDVLRTKFFINISHDLRTPLTLIREPLDVLLRNNKLNTDAKDKLNLIKRNVKRLNYLIEQLLDVRKAESGKLIAKTSKHDIIDFTKEEVAHFSYALKQKGLHLKINFDTDKLFVHFDQAMISKVYFNIVSNAIKFTDKGEIVINIEKVNREDHNILNNGLFNSYVKVEIRDTGNGISQDQKDKIFERFYQGQNQRGSGYGIGLSHTKELIDAHQGFIEVESTKRIGTTIRFFLPEINSTKNDEQNIATSTEDMYVDVENYPDPEEIIKNKTQTVLIVEDNADMRGFVKSELKKDFNILEAVDGLDGWEKAKEQLPDLIVSDVMMPNMDGIELCKNLKSNIETSHIPVILLTAKVDSKTKYESIETGADDYIPKPFEIGYLKIRIKNLLHSREQLRKLFQKSNILEPSKITVTSIDEKFLTALMEKIEKGIPDSSFSISSLESELGMSHANFYRKIKSLTGQSGQELLLTMRMKRASQILSEDKGLRISEVAYMVGFTNPKYFGKCFKQKFGVTPLKFAGK